MDKIRLRYVKLRVINAVLASFIYFMGAFTDGRVTKIEICMTIASAAVVFAAGIREIVDDEADLVKMSRYRLLTFF